MKRLYNRLVPSRPRINTTQALYLLPKGLGILLSIEMLQLLPDLEALYGPEGIISPGLIELWHSGSGWSISQLLAALPLGTVYVAAALYIVLCIALISGKWLRCTSILLLLLHHAFFLSEHRWSYGVDYLAQTGLFWSLCFGVSTPTTPPGSAHWWGLRLWQIQLSLVYVIGGIGKAIGTGWWTGEGLWRALMQPFGGQLFTIPINWGSWPYIWTILSCSVVLLELLHPLAFAGRIPRKIILSGTICMHVGIGCLLGLYHFAAVMIWFNLCTWYFPYKRLTKYDINYEPLDHSEDGTASTAHPAVAQYKERRSTSNR